MMKDIIGIVNRHTNFMRYSVTICIILFLSTLTFLTINQALAHSSRNELRQLEFIALKNYDYGSTTLEDYHPDQEPITEVQREQGFVINALVRNNNHTQEHFDFITEIFDRDGNVVHLNIRYGVAVNLGGQIPIDSARVPIILEPGTYLYKVFAWQNTDDAPIPLSEGAVGVVRVIP